MTYIGKHIHTHNLDANHGTRRVLLLRANATDLGRTLGPRLTLLRLVAIWGQAYATDFGCFLRPCLVLLLRTNAADLGCFIRPRVALLRRANATDLGRVLGPRLLTGRCKASNFWCSFRPRVALLLRADATDLGCIL